MDKPLFPPIGPAQGLPIDGKLGSGIHMATLSNGDIVVVIARACVRRMLPSGKGCIKVQEASLAITGHDATCVIIGPETTKGV